MPRRQPWAQGTRTKAQGTRTKVQGASLRNGRLESGGTAPWLLPPVGQSLLLSLENRMDSIGAYEMRTFAWERTRRGLPEVCCSVFGTDGLGVTTARSAGGSVRCSGRRHRGLCRFLCPYLQMNIPQSHCCGRSRNRDPSPSRPAAPLGLPEPVCALRSCGFHKREPRLQGGPLSAAVGRGRDRDGFSKPLPPAVRSIAPLAGTPPAPPAAAAAACLRAVAPRSVLPPGGC